MIPQIYLAFSNSIYTNFQSLTDIIRDKQRWTALLPTNRISNSTPTRRDLIWSSCGSIAWSTGNGERSCGARRWRRRASQRSGWRSWSGDASSTWFTTTRRARTTARASLSRASSWPTSPIASTATCRR